MYMHYKYQTMLYILSSFELLLGLVLIKIVDRAEVGNSKGKAVVFESTQSTAG